ncbi:unnamed protein product [Rotaria sp. Silwood2]|nr:unnamed protein product [Rotaria sp. Silwood2]CAF2694348.1 unnamed protein product [Rotaria sp. Silwood2]CAF2944365.1 unnamed protein product [Rotaria sp. Silwood2]CAF4085521.1 unnamed protein product [Rotaria sp. Silwood2]CAF4247221.1 unnamed protein product [Rotaria sp. Silwood2]
MRLLAILLFVVLSCFSAEALKKRQLQQAHAGYCPMHMMMCAVYCAPNFLNLQASRQTNGCARDSECAVDEKCCRPACGCANRCTKALEKPGFQKLA